MGRNRPLHEPHPAVIADAWRHKVTTMSRPPTPGLTVRQGQALRVFNRLTKTVRHVGLGQALALAMVFLCGCSSTLPRSVEDGRLKTVWEQIGNDDMMRVRG